MKDFCHKGPGPCHCLHPRHVGQGQKEVQHSSACVVGQARVGPLPWPLEESSLASPCAFLTAGKAPAKKVLMRWNVLGQQNSSFLEKQQLSGRARREDKGKGGRGSV